MFIHCCHCLNCQRQTGSAFVINLLIEADRVQFLAASPRSVDVPRDDGTLQRILRRPGCEVAVLSTYGWPEIAFVRAGTLDEPTGLAPDVHIYTRSKVGWLTLPEGTPAFDEYYHHEALWPAESLRRLQWHIPRVREPRLARARRPPVDHPPAYDADRPWWRNAPCRAELHAADGRAARACASLSPAPVDTTAAWAAKVSSRNAGGSVERWRIGTG